MKKLISIIICAALVLSGCTKRAADGRGSWAQGADLSWLSEMEHDGMLFYPADTAAMGQPDDCMTILAAMGMNAVRLRVWVNHATGWSNIPDMVSLAKRAADQGLRVMVDIHYSDFFADPHQQTIPAAWQDYDYPAMLQAVRAHTTEVLEALRAAGVTPEWVQIGNETPNGMLWPMARVSSDMTDSANIAAWQRYAALTTAGYEAAKSVMADICVIVHVDNAYERRDWFWQAMHEHGGKWDMIGLSHYPMMSAWNGGISWQQMNEMAEANIRQLIDTWHCPVMVTEIGTFADDPASVDVIRDFCGRARSIDGCAGIFYWEPEVYGGWRPSEYIPLGWGSYGMGAFTPDGQPSNVLSILFSSGDLEK